MWRCLRAAARRSICSTRRVRARLCLSLDRAARPLQSARLGRNPGRSRSTPEAEGFRDLLSEFRAQGVEVFGLSGRIERHQQESCARTRALPLLSDRVSVGALALPAFEAGGVAYLKRLTLVIRDGRIVRVFYPIHRPTSTRARFSTGSTKGGIAD